ncbi:MAG TPA: MmcQ/YjbR family DNA-binding protein [Terriglobales bacterium]|nr:MmcQ/YjbR family DNA-binding protein [Terriglobales bacterium]
MDIEAIREHCMSLPHVTEKAQWVRDLVFKVGGKMFCVMNLEPQRDEVVLSFKASDEEFIELQEIEGVVPAPYMARAKWVALQHRDVLPAPELKRLLGSARDLVFATLPKKVQQELSGAPPRPSRKRPAKGRRARARR